MGHRDTGDQLYMGEFKEDALGRSLNWASRMRCKIRWMGKARAVSRAKALRREGDSSRELQVLSH